MWAMLCVLGFAREVADERIVFDVTTDSLVVGPPTVITCKLLDSKNKITFVDLENLGIAREDYRVTDGRAMLPAAKLAVQAYRKLTKQHRLGKVSLTAATQAWEAYQVHALDYFKSMKRSYADVIRLEQAAYHPGRCECRRLGDIEGEGTLYHLDISSMYTAIGRNAMFPMNHFGTWLGPPEPDWKEPFDRTIIADVTLDTPEAYYPVCDIVNRLLPPEPSSYGERIIYPTGCFRAALCEPELNVAIAHGHIKEWHRTELYQAAPGS